MIRRRGGATISGIDRRGGRGVEVGGGHKAASDFGDFLHDVRARDAIASYIAMDSSGACRANKRCKSSMSKSFGFEIGA